MNSLRSLIAAILCVLLSPLPAVCAPADSAQRAGEIKALIPAATRNAQTAQAKDALAWNDLLQTGPSGRIRAGLLDGSILSLGSSSELRVVQHDSASQQTVLEMNLGKLRSKVVKITRPDGKFQVKTPNAVIGVIGTDFFVSYEGERTTVICYAGKVTVTALGNAKVNSNSQSANSAPVVPVILNAGQMVVISNDVPPSALHADSTPTAMSSASLTDTDVPMPRPPVVSHTLANLLIVGIPLVVAGVVIGVVSAKGSTTLPCVINPKTKQCG